MKNKQDLSLAQVAHEAAMQSGDLAGAALTLQIAILKGLIAQRVVDEAVLRSFLVGLISNLTPAEKNSAYGMCLATAAAALEQQEPADRPN